MNPREENYIRRITLRKTGKWGLSEYEQEEVLQEVFSYVISRYKDYQPMQSKWTTFLYYLVMGGISTWARKNKHEEAYIEEMLVEQKDDRARFLSSSKEDLEDAYIRKETQREQMAKIVEAARAAGVSLEKLLALDKSSIRQIKTALGLL